MNRFAIFFTALAACGAIPKSQIASGSTVPVGEHVMYRPVPCAQGGRQQLQEYELDDRFVVVSDNGAPSLYDISRPDSTSAEYVTNTWMVDGNRHFMWGTSKKSARHVILNEDNDTGEIRVYFNYLRTGGKLRPKLTEDGSLRPGRSTPVEFYCLERVSS